MPTRKDGARVRSIHTLVTILGALVLLGAIGSILNHETSGARFGLVFGIALVVLGEWSRWRDHHR